MPTLRARRGTTLVELIVALLLLELIGAGALMAVLTAERVGQHARRGGAEDLARWQRYREAELAGDCTDSAAFRTVPMVLPAMGGRAPLPLVLPCGR